MTEWLHWEGGECPVPEGVAVELIFRNGDKTSELVQPPNWAHYTNIRRNNDIVAYRIIGLADGWTDDEELAK